MLLTVRTTHQPASDLGYLLAKHLIQFEALRVFSDDVVQPGMDFPTHSHEEEVVIHAADDADLVLINVPPCKDFGYDRHNLRGGAAR